MCLGAWASRLSAQYMGGQLSYVERLMTSGRVFLEYLRLIFFPVNMAGDYDFNAIPIANFASWDAWLGLFLIVCDRRLCACFIAGAIGWRASVFCSRLLVFVPASNWIMPISVLMAERFLYLPLIGLSMAAAVVVQRYHEIAAAATDWRRYAVDGNRSLQQPRLTFAETISLFSATWCGSCPTAPKQAGLWLCAAAGWCQGRRRTATGSWATDHPGLS